MRRALVPVGAATFALAVGAGATALSASGRPTPSPMRMSMDAGASAASPTVVRLRKKVVRVAIRNFRFSPAKVVVSPGTRIVWTNRDSDPHTVTSRKAHWASPAVDTGRSYARTVRRKGTVRYVCSIHPFMHGTVIVK